MVEKKLALINIAIDKEAPPLGLCSIATYLKKYAGFENTTIIDINYEDIFESLKKLKPDIIGLSSMTIYYPAAIRIAKKIKKLYDIPIIIGCLIFTGKI